MCFKLLKRQKNNNIKTYEQELFNTYGNCNKLTKSISVLVFADTHNMFSYDTSKLEEVKNMQFDVCLLLGDHSLTDVTEILKVVPISKVFGIRGNHDKSDILTTCGIQNINGKVINVNGIKIGAIQGSIKYKETTAPLYTHEESLQIAEQLTNVDILISHDTYFVKDSNEITHDGLKGITEAIYRNHTPVHIHGHLHVNDQQTLLNGTKSYGVYGVTLLNL